MAPLGAGFSGSPPAGHFPRHSPNLDSGPASPGLSWSGACPSGRDRPTASVRAGPIAVPTGAEASAFDRHAIEGRGVPEAALMESAGRAAADLADHLAPSGRVCVLAGRGNNGGDAVVVARTLHARGREVQLVLVGRDADDPLLHGWSVPTVEFSAALLENAALVVDGVLGTGLNGAPREPAASVLSRVADIAGPVLALDVPSGVVADTGAAPGPAVRASATVAFGWPKLGTLLEPGRSHTGRLVVAEIGFPPLGGGGYGARLLTPAWADEVAPVRATSTHKNQVGAVLVVGGGEGMAGAPFSPLGRLCDRAPGTCGSRPIRRLVPYSRPRCPMHRSSRSTTRTIWRLP